MCWAYYGVFHAEVPKREGRTGGEMLSIFRIAGARLLRRDMGCYIELALWSEVGLTKATD